MTFIEGNNPLLPAETNTIITDPMIPNLFTIKKIFWETDDTFTIEIESHDKSNFNFKPGQFNMLYVFGMGESAISICSDPAKNKTILHTIHRVGNVTSKLSQLKKGDTIGVRGPFGSNWDVTKFYGKDVVIVVGGIGLAPLRPAIYSIFKERKKFNRIIILYGARTALDLLYRVELEHWSKTKNVEVLTTIDRGDSSWRGNIGVVTNLFNYIKLDAMNTYSMVCGPEIMMKFSIEELVKLGVEERNIYLSLERNMKCAIGFCGHCQYTSKFICKDGPVFNYSQVKDIFNLYEV